MRLSPVLLVALTVASSPAAASWWSSDKPEYSSWDTKQLQSWLHEHNIDTPKGYSQQELQDLVSANWNSASSWTLEQYERAQKVFANAKDDAFDSWDESRLREFLLEQGVVAPSGPREQLVLAAKNHYRAYTNAASSFASTASSAASTAVYGDKTSQASKSATSFYGEATSFYGDATNSASSAAAQATESLARALDDSKDYVYSTWDDNQLRDYLVKKNVIKSNQEATRDQMLAYMRDSYAAVTNPIWQAWSDSYIVSRLSFCFRLLYSITVLSTNGSSPMDSSNPTSKRSVMRLLLGCRTITTLRSSRSGTRGPRATPATG